MKYIILINNITFNVYDSSMIPDPLPLRVSFEYLSEYISPSIFEE